MIFPSLTKIILIVFVLYLCQSLYSIYTIFKSPQCENSRNCVNYYLKSAPRLQMVLFTSVKSTPVSSHNVQHVTTFSNVNYTVPFEKSLNLSMPAETQRNGSLFLHIFLLPVSFKARSWNEASSSANSVYLKVKLTDYHVPMTSTYQLLVGDKDNSNKKTVSHLKSEIGVRILTGVDSLPSNNIPMELYKYFKLANGVLLPIMIFDVLNDRVSYFKNTTVRPYGEILFKYSPINLGKLRFMVLIDSQFNALKMYGFSQKDIDEVKGVFADTNVYLLCVTIFVASVHLLLETLAFKNDVSFWKNRQSMVGLSARAVVWRAFSQVIIFFYLLDEETSLLVLGPAAVGTLIEFWKVQKILHFDWKKMKFRKSDFSKEELNTQSFDAEGMHYLSYILYPLCIGAAAYSLLYLEHKSWYSWIIHSLVNCVYAFGFLFMLPQLFINYKMKSVAHLPWKAFMYKAFNTFIDDLFAFIITMPTAHRLACFRDDFVFLIYLYQRWLYPVDSSRLDEAAAAGGHIKED